MAPWLFSEYAPALTKVYMIHSFLQLALRHSVLITFELLVYFCNCCIFV